MKYELPDDLKRHIFPCEKAKDIASYGRCKRRCPNTYRQCWEQHLREDLYRDCAIENERHARSYVICSHCGAKCDIGTPSNRFLCSDCGNTEYCDDTEQKRLMGDAYMQIDERELSQALKRI